MGNTKPFRQFTTLLKSKVSVQKTADGLMKKLCGSRTLSTFFTSQNENYIGDSMLCLWQGIYFNLTKRDNLF